MRVWTVKEGEPLPVKGCPGRQMRTGLISEILADRGHDVTWWTSDFFNQTKTRLADGETVVRLRENFSLHMLHAKTEYRKNVSLSRLQYNREIGKEFARAIESAEKPDVIICSFPLIEFAFEAVKYAKKRGVPVIVDVRDLWPDTFWEWFPRPLHAPVRAACASMIRKTKYVLQNADVVVGVMPKCMDFARGYGRKASPLDGVYYLGYKEKAFSEEERQKAGAFWQNLGVTEKDFVLCWIGQISSRRTDFETVANVAAKTPGCKFVICGEGDSKAELEAKYADNKNIIFPGFLDQSTLEALMRISAVGVIPIRDTADFRDSVSNKAIEYMAGSLCVATTLKGLLRDTVEQNELGFFYESADEFAQKLESVMNDRALLGKYKKNARAYYEANFQSDVIYGKLCDLAEKLAK